MSFKIKTERRKLKYSKIPHKDYPEIDYNKTTISRFLVTVLQYVLPTIEDRPTKKTTFVQSQSWYQKEGFNVV